MNVSVKSAIAATTILAMQGIASAAYLTVDFESDTVGSDPAASFINEPASSDVRVLDGATTPADPFGGAGNQSLLLDKVTQAANSPYASWKGAPGGLTTGTFTIQWVLKDGGRATGAQDGYDDYQYTNFILGDTAGSATLTTDAIALYQAGTAFGFYGAGGGNFDQATNPAGQVNTLVINFDTATDQFSGTLNTVQLTRAAATSFAFQSAASLIDSFQVGPDYWTGPYDHQLFVDNVVLDAVPEPAAMSLLGLGALALRRRK